MANISDILLPSLTTSSTTSDGILISFPHYGDKVRGSGYYKNSEAMHTVQYVTRGFIGVIMLQGSLATDPQDDDWYYIPSTAHGDGITPADNEATTLNFGGNHIWLRAAIVSFIAGNINKALLNHN